jgi:hypothetical protein
MKSKTNLMILAAALGLGLSGASALAQFTVTNPGPINSAEAPGNALNGILNYTYAGPNFLASGVTLSGTLTSATSGTYASEACLRVIAPDSSFRDITSGFTSTGSYTSLNLTNVLRGWTPNIGGTSAGTWQFRFFESYVDNPGGADSIWTNVSITANAYTPPAPPAGAIDLGHLGAGGMLMAQNPYTANTVQWYKFTLDSAIGAGDLFRAHTFGNTLVGGQFGAGDTQIALFDSTGAVLGSSDDTGGERWSDIQNTGGLVAGDYYIAASAYQLSFGAGWQASASDRGTVTGDIKLTITPAPSSLALLGLGGLVGARRRRR